MRASVSGTEGRQFDPDRVRQFDCGCGEIGRRTTLRGWRSQGHGGSTPLIRTMRQITVVAPVAGSYPVVFGPVGSSPAWRTILLKQVVPSSLLGGNSNGIKRRFASG